MPTGKIKINGIYGTTIGNIICFTYERAIEVYKTFLEICHKDFSQESCAVLSEIEMQLQKIGFEPDYIESVEIDFLESSNL